MANIEKIKVGSTSYDVRDASAAHALTDIASAGTNVTFTTSTIDDYSIAGTGVTVTSGIASGFSQSSYVYKGVSVWNSAVSGGAFVLQIKFKINSYASNDFSNSVIRIPSSDYDNGTPSFSANITSIRRLRFWDSDYASPAYTISTGVDYWLREVYDGGSTVSLQISTDGTSFTEIHTENFAPSTSAATNMILGMGKLNYTTQLLGSIDLTQTYIKDGNGNVIWAASAPASVPQINATDTTYSAFTGADGVNAGTAGLVPAPTATDNTKFLKGDGTWAEAGGGGSASYDADTQTITL